MAKRRKHEPEPEVRALILGDGLGERLTNALADSPHKLAKIARACDVSWLTVKRWSVEEATPKIPTLIDLAEVLNTTAGSLIGHYPTNPAWEAFYKKRRRELDDRMVENLKSVAMAGIRPTVDLYDDLYLALRRGADKTDLGEDEG